MAAEGENSRISGNPPAKDWVRRLVHAQGVVLDERQLGWWTFHLESFLRYCRRRGEQVDVKILARGFLDELSGSEPPVASLRIDQTRQALTVFVRGVEHWHWEQAQDGAWAPRFRMKPGVESAPPPPGPAAAATIAAVDRTSWESALRTALRVRHYALRTEQTYTQWARQFLGFHPATPLGDLGPEQVRRFLEHLAVGRNVTATTQNQALSALLFFFQYVLGRELGELGETVRGKRGRKLPIVLSREEVRNLLAATEGTGALMLRLMYGGGLRLMECLRLRVKDVDLERELVNVRSGKGNKDRTVPVPRSLQAELARHRERLRVLHEADRRENLPGVWMPDALGVKYPRAGEEWGLGQGCAHLSRFRPSAKTLARRTAVRRVRSGGNGFFPAKARAWIRAPDCGADITSMTTRCT